MSPPRRSDDGVARRHWATASSIREIFRRAFEAAGLPYFNPHSIRNTLVQLGQTRCKDPEQFKAWSQNLGHEGVLTTFLSYGSVAQSRQGQIIKGLTGQQAVDGDVEALAQAAVRAVLDMRSQGTRG